MKVKKRADFRSIRKKLVAHIVLEKMISQARFSLPDIRYVSSRRLLVTIGCPMLLCCASTLAQFQL